MGFFNNVNLVSVGENLEKSSVPKWVAIHFLNLVASDVKNITPKSLEQCLESDT